MYDEPYQPTDDPRYLPSIDLTERLAFFDSTQIDLQAEVAAIGEVLAIFDRPGFVSILAEMDRHERSIDAHMRRTFEQGPWMYLRGQLVMIQWLRDLPDEYKRMAEAAYAKMREVDEQIDEIQQGAE